jgi:transcriptional regulator with XRE-family HTH domain
MRISRERVELLLQSKGWTLGQLHVQARRFRPSLSWSSLSEVVNGRRSPTLKMLEAIAQTLETSVGYLTGETENPASPAITTFTVAPKALGLAEARAAYTPLTPEVSALADRINALADGQREQIVALANAILDFSAVASGEQVGAVFGRAMPALLEAEQAQLAEGLREDAQRYGIEPATTQPTKTAGGQVATA